MKRLTSFPVVLSLVLTTFAFQSLEAKSPEKALFVSVIQSPPVLSDRKAIEDLIRRANRSHVSVLYIQVYRANKSWFPSALADDSEYGASLEKVGEDPFALLIRLAQKEGIEVHAWLNVLSLSANKDAPLLKKYGTSVLTRNTEPKKDLESYRIDRQFFLEPGDPRVVRTLEEIVGEVALRYPTLNGIQLDYIRYPDTNPSYGHTELNLQKFRRKFRREPLGEQDPDWRAWKRQQITSLVRRLRNKARSISPKIQFSTTGLVPYVRAREESFQDWKEWVRSGLIDFVTLMCYSEETAQLDQYIKDAQKQLPGLKKVGVALGAYKFIDHPEIFNTQWERCEEANGRSCAALAYGDLRQGMKF